MHYKTVSLSILAAAALAVAPLSPASAHDHFRHGGGVVFGLAAAAAAVVGTAAVIATAPFRAIAAAPVYAAPAPAYYAPPAQAYYAPQPQAYYAPQPQAYYARRRRRPTTPRRAITRRPAIIPGDGGRDRKPRSPARRPAVA